MRGRPGRPRPRTRGLAPAAAAAILWAGPAAAHGSMPGGGDFLMGLLHPVGTVEHLILLLAIGLLAGRTPRERRGPILAATGAGLLAGLAAGRAADPVAAVPVAILVLAGLAGGLLALAPRRVPPWLVPVLAGLAGLAVGLDTTAGAGEPMRGVALAGVVAGAGLAVLDSAALAAAANRPPLPVGVRIAGSWIAAIAIILLAFAASPSKGAA